MSAASIARYEASLYGKPREITARTIRVLVSHNVNRIMSQGEFDALHAQRMMERTRRAGV